MNEAEIKPSEEKKIKPASWIPQLSPKTGLAVGFVGFFLVGLLIGWAGEFSRAKTRHEALEHFHFPDISQSKTETLSKLSSARDKFVRGSKELLHEIDLNMKHLWHSIKDKTVGEETQPLLKQKSYVLSSSYQEGGVYISYLNDNSTETIDVHEISPDTGPKDDQTKLRILNRFRKRFGLSVATIEDLDKVSIQVHAPAKPHFYYRAVRREGDEVYRYENDDGVEKLSVLGKEGAPKLPIINNFRRGFGLSPLESLDAPSIASLSQTGECPSTVMECPLEKEQQPFKHSHKEPGHVHHAEHEHEHGHEHMHSHKESGHVHHAEHEHEHGHEQMHKSPVLLGEAETIPFHV